MTDARAKELVLKAIADWLVECWPDVTMTYEQIQKLRDLIVPRLLSPQEEVERLKADNFALAADQCQAGYAGEHGHHRCREIDNRDALIAELVKALEEIAKDAYLDDWTLEFVTTRPAIIARKALTAAKAAQGL